MYIKNIKITRNKKIINLKKCNLIKAFGIEGDDKAGKVLREVALYILPKNDIVSSKNGLCINKFKANLEIEIYDDEIIKINDTLQIGSSLLKVSSVGKKCYSNCNLIKENLPCPLKNNVLFCSVLREGTITLGDLVLL